jgi:hypothetical protein
MKTMNDIPRVGERELRRLAYVKALFRIGIDHLERCTEPNAAQALLTFDNCIEMMLWLMVDFHGIRIKQTKQLTTLPQLLSQVSAELSEQDTSRILLRHASDLQELHIARNNVQHHGILPSFSTVHRYRVITESVLVGLVEDVLKLSWSEISMALLVSDPAVRELYSRAENEYENQNYFEAALNLVAAFECMRGKETDRRAGSGISLSRFFADLAKEESKESGNPHINTLVQYAKAIEGEVEILKLGLDYKGFQRYRDFAKIDPLDHFDVNISGNVSEALAVVREKIGPMKPDFKLQEWVVFAFGFVLDSILQWQFILREGAVESLIRSIDERLTSEIKRQDTMIEPLDQPP